VEDATFAYGSRWMSGMTTVFLGCPEMTIAGQRHL